MAEVRVRVGALRGLHGRPAALFAARASRLDAVGVRVARADEPDGPWCDATNVLDLLSLDIARGEDVLLRTERTDDEGALAELAAMLESDLDAE